MTDARPQAQLKINCRVNGRLVVETIEARMTVADFLREVLGLTGTHLGCEHGVCGACTVVLDGLAVRSCIIFAPQLDGSDVLTVEGLASDGELTPLQQEFRDNHALQCGFCTPGFLMTSHALIESEIQLDDDAVRNEIGGNICRCTAYEEIVTAIQRAGQRERG